ncbi:3616_t:CDS:1, partial [Ambispora leptoticha]
SNNAKNISKSFSINKNRSDNVDSNTENKTPTIIKSKSVSLKTKKTTILNRVNKKQRLNTMTQKSSLHFYEEGDCELIAETTCFRIHKNIIALSSMVFKDLFASVSPTFDDMNIDQQTGRLIPRIPLTDESASNIEMLLSFLYPNTFFEIDWNSVADLLHLADKYIIDTLTAACVAFLKRSFHEHPMTTLQLAEKYRIAQLYKEASKLVLNSFDHIFYDPRRLQGLSKSTETKLKVQRQEYVEGLNKIYCVTVDRQFPPLQADHLRSKFEECVKDVCTFPLPAPSETWRKLHRVDCSRHFECREELRRLKPFISEKIIMMFGRYEPLLWKKSSYDDDDLYYPFIELD